VNLDTKQKLRRTRLAQPYRKRFVKRSGPARQNGSPIFLIRARKKSGAGNYSRRRRRIEYQNSVDG
jgi:hypothetical protein